MDSPLSPLRNPYDPTSQEDVHILPAIKGWIWKTPPVTRLTCFVNLLCWLCTALPVDEQWKPRLCVSALIDSHGGSPGTHSLVLIGRLFGWYLDGSNSIVATVAVVVVHREVSRLEQREGSIHAFGVIMFLWLFQVCVFVLGAFLFGSSEASMAGQLCLAGPMGVAFGVKQLENQVHPKEEKLFLCSNLYFPASLHMLPAAVLWQLLSLVVTDALDVSVFLGVFGGVVLGLLCGANGCLSWRLCRRRIDGLEKKECLWLSRSSAYVKMKSESQGAVSPRYSQNQLLRSRTPSRRLEEASEETQLLIDSTLT